MGWIWPEEAYKIDFILDWFRKDSSHNCVYMYWNNQENKDVYMIALRDEVGKLIGYYEKHAYREQEQGMLYDLTQHWRMYTKALK